ncbi:serine hydrolase domain-containing protein [Microbacterium sediminicola]|uniref:Serine hydrolase domain-containing protein n=1 Tax=Microbacterium sediminicola TaxID=415210 RepID=A0ABN2I8N1_9MICO
MRTRRRIVAAAALAAAAILGAGCAAQPSASTSPDPETVAAIEETVATFFADHPVNAVIVKVTAGEQELYRAALGESMTGVPATPEMHFRNGAVAISYVAMVLLQLDDEGVLSVDDLVSQYLPSAPYADEVTLRELAQMTSGIQDYVPVLQFQDDLMADPFHLWTADELLSYVADEPLWFEPGTNFGYSHAGYVILGHALEAATGETLSALIQERILDPLELTGTHATLTAEIPEPALHAFSSERRGFFGVAEGVPFSEESSYWSPSWTISHGAVQTSTIDDLSTTIRAIGTGALLSPEAHEAMVSTALRGFGEPVEGCPGCFTQSEGYTYGIGLVNTGDWIMQNPLFSGYAAVTAYLASEDIAISVAVTFAPDAFAADGSYPNLADTLFRDLGAVLAPDDAPPVRR